MQEYNKEIKFYLQSSIKSSQSSMDKALSPTQTFLRAMARLEACGMQIVERVSRIDCGRLDIPVYISTVGTDAKTVMPTKKQMGKGHSEEQAKASAIMELIERYGFFNFWRKDKIVIYTSYGQAQNLLGDKLIDFDLILSSVQEKIAPELGREIFDMLNWSFYPTLHIASGKELWIPLEWFKMLNEFNGSAAGNTDAEALLQAVCELVERHVCAIISREKRALPNIDLSNIDDDILRDLIDKFAKNNVKLILKDFSLDMPLPTIAAIAYDLSTLGQKSEIVYTAGTATTPVKAAIRAITEVAQLGGDFCTSSCYEASGLPKYEDLADISWLEAGQTVKLNELPSLENIDLLVELENSVHKLQEQGFEIFAINTTVDGLNIPSCYVIGTGFLFRERDINACLGLSIGRRLLEECDIDHAKQGLDFLSKIYKDKSFIYFFKARLSTGPAVLDLYAKAMQLEQDADSYALIAYYGAYTLIQEEDFNSALDWLDKACIKAPDFAELFSARGLCHFKLQNFVQARDDFLKAVKINKSSVQDLANLGACYEELKEFDLARKYLQAALTLDSDLQRAKERLAGLDKIGHNIDL